MINQIRRSISRRALRRSEELKREIKEKMTRNNKIPKKFKRDGLREVDVIGKAMAVLEESNNFLELPNKSQKVFIAEDEMIYGNNVRFFQGRNDDECAIELIQFYTEETPRVLILPDYSPWDSKRLSIGE